MNSGWCLIYIKTIQKHDLPLQEIVMKIHTGFVRKAWETGAVWAP